MITPVPLIPGVVVTCRPIGVLKMDDEAGGDDKLLAVPIDKILSIYTHWQKPEDLNPLRLKTIQHFFEHYKDLEPGKWVKVRGWEGPEAAREEIRDGIAALRRRTRVGADRRPRAAGSSGCGSAGVALNGRLRSFELVQVGVDARRPRAPGSRRSRRRTRGCASQCAERVSTGSRPRAILCSPWAPPSKRS